MEEPSARVERIKQLVNDIGLGGALEIVAIVVLALVIIAVLRRVLEFLAGVVPSRIRLYVLGAVPVLRLLLLLIAIGLIVPIVFDVTLSNFVFIAGGLSVALGFAFKDLASSVIAGIVALVEKPYRAGDWVQIGKHYGEVRHVGMRALKLVTPDDDVVTVAHDRIWAESISTSNDGASTLMCVALFHAVGEHDSRELRDALQDVALTSAWLDLDRPILVIIDQHPWGTRYQLKAYPFDLRHQFLFITDLTVRGRAVMQQLGIREAHVPGLPEATPGRE